MLSFIRLPQNAPAVFLTCMTIAFIEYLFNCFPELLQPSLYLYSYNHSHLQFRLTFPYTPLRLLHLCKRAGQAVLMSGQGSWSGTEKEPCSCPAYRAVREHVQSSSCFVLRGQTVLQHFDECGYTCIELRHICLRVICLDHEVRSLFLFDAELLDRLMLNIVGMACLESHL